MEKELEIGKKRLLDSITELKDKGFSPQQILEFVNATLEVSPKEEIRIPIHVFKNSDLGSLETIVKYLRENLLLTFRQIAELTGRNPVALAVSYRNARIKLSKPFAEEISTYSIPVSILINRKLSVLENLAAYMKDTFGLTYHNIALLLNRDDRTIWTVYQRAIKKRK